MAHMFRLYRRVTSSPSLLQSAMLLAARLYCGFQFVQAGWGKLLNLVKIMGFSASLTIPFSSFGVPFVSTLELAGGVCLSARPVYTPVALLLPCNMFVAYWTVGRDVLCAIFSDPGKFYTADPYTFLFVSLMVLIFGAGWFAVDTAVAKRLKAVEQ